MLSEIQSCGYIIGTYIIFEFLGKEVKRYESNFKIRYLITAWLLFKIFQILFWASRIEIRSHFIVFKKSFVSWGSR